MVKTLSNTARLLLHSLIHDSDDWWQAVPDLRERNRALDELYDYKLIEIKEATKQCRATKRGIKSNQKLLRSIHAPCLRLVK